MANQITIYPKRIDVDIESWDDVIEEIPEKELFEYIDSNLQGEMLDFIGEDNVKKHFEIGE